ncbi:MAG: hypothetical protein HY547_06730, partial [Elusimicrobia bacterium]|nr:hypothetical protein [Elusimicrobiota bacterium]
MLSLSLTLDLWAASSTTPNNLRIINVSTNSAGLNFRERNSGNVTYTLIASTNSSLGPVFSSGTFTDEASANNKITSGTLANLLTNTRYWLSVNAQKSGSSSSSFATAVATVTLSPSVDPAFSWVAVTSASLSWTPASGLVSSYLLEAATASAFSS